MLLLQILVFLFILIAFIGTLLRFREGKIGRRWFAFWIIFWILAGLVVLLPDTTRALAAILGVSRAVDLVVYVAILILFALVFRILLKIESLEQEITKVVRAVALRGTDEQD